MKRLLQWLTYILITLSLMGCAREKTWRIGVSQCSQDDWRAKMNDEILREIMMHEDAEVEIRSADDSNIKQTEDIRYFADNKFDIIIVSPNEADALTPIIEEVYDKGIPVIIFDRNINPASDRYTARIGVDDKGLGKSAAHYALHLLGGGAKALEIFGLPGSTPAEDRHEGFSTELLAKGGSIVASVPGDWNQEEAIHAADSLLPLHPEVNLIFAHNDRMAIGAAEVARRLGRDSIRIIGIDAAPNIGIQAVEDGVIDATFLYPTEGHRLIQTALKILKGEPYEKEVLIPASSAVDKSNADILLLQNENLVAETTKMRVLKGQIDDYWAQHSSQTILFYASIIILVLVCGLLFLVLRSFWQNRRHQGQLMERNRMLQEERDKQKELNHRLQEERDKQKELNHRLEEERDKQKELNHRLEEERDKQKELNHRLEEATQSKLVFFTNVSHDLRTPLTLIAEPVAQLAGADNLTPSQHSLIKIADKNVKILQRLINQILDFRKYENGKLDLHLSEVNLPTLLDDWMESFYQIARKRDIHLSLKLEGECEATLAVDVEKMERVFFNLVSNAFKYTPDNGDITVIYEHTDNMVTIRVKDTGEGISTRDLGNIFDRFYQVDRVHPKGSGIGLSLAKAFVELHGGSISVESELNKGSEFTVRIPVTHVETQAPEVVKHIDAATAVAELEDIDTETNFNEDKPVLLIIDDNRDIRQMVSSLMGNDYNVVQAPGGSEGIKKAAKYVPDVIICDVMMPGMDGLECCRHLKEEVSTSHIPVLMLTACSMDEQRVQGYESGADAYLSKPFSTDVLKARCRSLIENRKRIKSVWQTTAAPSAPEKSKERVQKEISNNTKRQGDIDSEFYNRFIELFTAEMGNSEISVDSLAAKMGLERTQFYRKIKALTNYSPVELMRSLRLKRARMLVTSTEKSISEIGYEVGFSTPAYFTKCYREAYGETPSETRAKLTGK